MKDSLRNLGRLLTRRSQAGQSVVLLAIAMIALIAFVGLVTDISLLFVRYSTLRRAVDMASIAAAGQIREGRDHLDIVSAAYQFVTLHGVGVDAINEIFVETCETNPGDPELCTLPRRKLVRVIAQIDSPTTFLAVLGWGSIRLEASATAEAAVVDVALVLDTSESMSKETCFQGVGDAGVACDGRDDFQGILPNPAVGGWRTTPDGFTYYYYDKNGDGQITIPQDISKNFTYGSPVNDQAWGVYCNDPNGDGWFNDLVCQPFKQVREAAAAFIDQLDFVRGDRVAIITFDRFPILRDPDCVLPAAITDPGTPSCLRDGPLTGLIDNEGLARAVLLGDPTYYNPGDAGYPYREALRGIGVYINPYPSDRWNWCWTDPTTWGDPLPWAYEKIAPCGNTNLGGGIRAADSVLRGYHPRTGADMGTARHEAVWVMVLLTDGAANVTDPKDPLPPSPTDYGYFGYCPPDTFRDDPNNPGQTGVAPYCRDDDAWSRHSSTDANYDADDYARDWADSASLSPEEGGDFIATFAIGLGAEVLWSKPYTQPWHGEALLRYIADVGDNGHRDGTGDWENGIPDPDPFSVSECENVAHGVVGGTNPSCGNYFSAPDAHGLQAIVSEIASRMFTRVAR